MNGCQRLIAYQRITVSYFHEIFEDCFHWGSYLYKCDVGNMLINIKYKKQKTTQRRAIKSISENREITCSNSATEYKNIARSRHCSITTVSLEQVHSNV